MEDIGTPDNGSTVSILIILEMPPSGVFRFMVVTGAAILEMGVAMLELGVGVAMFVTGVVKLEVGVIVLEIGVVRVVFVLDVRIGAGAIGIGVFARLFPRRLVVVFCEGFVIPV